MGGGFEIALACDLIVASENAVFALPEPRVGLAALAGGLHRLPRAIGLKRAMGMILTARRVSAARAWSSASSTRWSRPGELMAAAKRWAGLIAECSPMSIRASKQAVLKGLDEPTLEAAHQGPEPLSGRRRPVPLGGLRRGPAGVRRKARAEVEGAVASPFGHSRAYVPASQEHGASVRRRAGPPTAWLRPRGLASMHRVLGSRTTPGDDGCWGFG